MGKYKGKGISIKQSIKHYIIILAVAIFIVNFTLMALDEDGIIMKKMLFFLNDSFYLEYIVRFIRVLIFLVGFTVLFIYSVFVEKGFNSKGDAIFTVTLILIPLIISIIVSSNYIRDLGTVINNSFDTSIVKNSSIDIAKGKKYNYYYVKIADGKELTLTFEQYSSVKNKSGKQKTSVYYLKNSETVLKIEPYGE